MDGTAPPIRSSTRSQTTNQSARLCPGAICMRGCKYKMRLLWLTGNSTTYFNVIISVVAIFILLLKIILFVMGVFHPLLSLFVHAGLAAVYAVAIHNQAASDMSDPAHPQPGAPWYITKSCGPPVDPSLNGYCKQAKAAFAITIILTLVYLLSEISLLRLTVNAVRSMSSTSYLRWSRYIRLRHSVSRDTPNCQIRRLDISLGKCWKHRGHRAQPGASKVPPRQERRLSISCLAKEIKTMGRLQSEREMLE